MGRIRYFRGASAILAVQRMREDGWHVDNRYWIISNVRNYYTFFHSTFGRRRRSIYQTRIYTDRAMSKCHRPIIASLRYFHNVDQKKDIFINLILRIKNISIEKVLEKFIYLHATFFFHSLVFGDDLLLNACD